MLAQCIGKLPWALDGKEHLLTSSNRRDVQDCETEDEDSFKHVKEFVVNWEASNEDDEFASNGVVPLLQKDWISDIGSFKCR